MNGKIKVLVDCSKRTILSVKWDDYSRKYNDLCNDIIKLGIDPKRLDDVIKAREKIGF